MSPIRHFAHLITRFFGVVRSNPLGPAEQDRVNSWLSAQEAALFWEQQPIDQRHALDVASRVRAAIGDDQAVTTAALLHDVGKRHSRLGAIPRSLATVLGATSLPMPSAWRLYLQHEALGAADLAEIETHDLAIAFAAGKPAGDRSVWDALVAADNGQQHHARKSTADNLSRNTIPPEVSG